MGSGHLGPPGAARVVPMEGKRGPLDPWQKMTHTPLDDTLPWWVAYFLGTSRQGWAIANGVPIMACQLEQIRLAHDLHSIEKLKVKCGLWGYGEWCGLRWS